MSAPIDKRKPLTKREREVLALAAEGQGVEETATTLYVVPSTVKFHRHRIMVKLDAPNMTAAVMAAIRRGLFF